MTFAHNKSVATLFAMLTYCRPGGSDTEEAFIDKFIRRYEPHQDAFGNLWVQVGEEDPRIMWSCHTDTVHYYEGRQKVTLDKETGMIKLRHPKLKTCLGADDGAGVWLACEMIDAGVPGLYVFHREEETGGGGSRWIAREKPHYLKGIEIAIALDRAGYTDVITHQGGRCCSDKFAGQLAALLGHGFKPDDTGVFTDTANYTHLIPECTNLSVGYFSQHGPTERLDLAFVMNLRDTLIKTDFSVLTAHRDPSVVDDEPWWMKESDFASFSGGLPEYDGDDDMVKMIARNPEGVAEFLRQLGYDETSLEDALWEDERAYH